MHTYFQVHMAAPNAQEISSQVEEPLFFFHMEKNRTL
jgi:hypothetical protein